MVYICSFIVLKLDIAGQEMSSVPWCVIGNYAIKNIFDQSDVCVFVSLLFSVPRCSLDISARIR